VLCGSLELVGAQPNVRKRSVYQRQFVGDRAYFEGGKRDADCYSRSEGTVIAVLKYTAIHQLALTEVGIRLVRILGATSAALVTQGIQQEAAEEKLKFVPCLTDELTPLVLNLARVSQSPLLSTFTPEQLRTLAQLMMVSVLENVSCYGSCEGMSRLQVTEAAEGETILRAGRKSMHLCIVLTGEVEARVGRARLIHRQGDCVGSTATLRSAAHATDFVACCQVRLAVLTRDDLDQLPMHHADLYRTVIFAITRVSLAETAAVEALLPQAAEEGYARICVPLQDEPELAALAAQAELLVRSRLCPTPGSSHRGSRRGSAEQRRGSALGSEVGAASMEKLLTEMAKRVALEEECARLRVEVEQVRPAGRSCAPVAGWWHLWAHRRARRVPAGSNEGLPVAAAGPQRALARPPAHPMCAKRYRPTRLHWQPCGSAAA
jgi:CRP-like cAMP-binding protein